jgi:hypothetical protein
MTKEAFRSGPILPRLYQNLDDYIVLIDSSP